MFDGFDMNKMQDMLKDMQDKAQAMQEQVKATTYSVKGGGGLIEVSANGAGEIIDINIDDSLLEDKDSLQILLISTINDAIKMAEDNKKSQALNMFGGMNPFGGNS
jgi:DNA-binding YbaB/EbfC family protein